jgi:hypothetical protein
VKQHVIYDMNNSATIHATITTKHDQDQQVKIKETFASKLNCTHYFVSVFSSNSSQANRNYKNSQAKH